MTTPTTTAKFTNVHQPSWPAALYANARPDYPRSAIDTVLSAVPQQRDPFHYVDLGAGTGIFTRLLVEACAESDDGKNTRRLASVTAVEPSTSMRHELASKLFEEPAGVIPTLKQHGKLSHDVRVNSLQGRFETIDLTSLQLQGKVDLLSIAQAWHWCEDRNAALNAIANVLRPGGVLAFVWNLEDREAAHWVARVRDSYESYEGDFPQYRHGTWREMYDTDGIKKYDILPEFHLQRSLPTTVDGVCNRVLSKSFVSMLPSETQQQIRQNIVRIFDTESDETLQRKWIDKAAGTFEYPYATDVVLLRKK